MTQITDGFIWCEAVSDCPQILRIKRRVRNAIIWFLLAPIVCKCLIKANTALEVKCKDKTVTCPS